MTVEGPVEGRKFVFAAACIGMLLFGIVMTVLGTILPSLIERFAVDKTAAGSSITLLSVGILIGSVIFGPVVDRHGYRWLLIVSAFFVLLGLEAIAFAPNFDLLRVSVFVVGLGGGVINGAVNALVADISPESRSAGLSYLGVFFGIGAFGVPLLLGFLLDRFTYSTLTACIGLTVLFAIVYFGLVQFPKPKRPQGFPLSEGKKMIRDPALLLLGAILFLQSGIEMTASGWTSTYFNESLGVAPGPAAFALSLFWVGMTTARFVIGQLLKTWPPARVLRSCVSVAMVGSILLVAADTPWLAYVGVFLTGAGLSAGFPVGLGFGGDLYPDVSGTAFSILFVMALTGGSVAPLLAGWLGTEFSLRIAFVLTPIFLVGMLVLLRLVLSRMESTAASGSNR